MNLSQDNTVGAMLDNRVLTTISEDEMVQLMTELSSDERLELEANINAINNTLITRLETLTDSDQKILKEELKDSLLNSTVSEKTQKIIATVILGSLNRVNMEFQPDETKLKLSTFKDDVNAFIKKYDLESPIPDFQKKTEAAAD